MRFVCIYPTAHVLERAREMAEGIILCLPGDLGDRVRTVLIEGVTNAVQANQRNNGKSVRISLFYDGKRVVLVIGDQGGGFDPPSTIRMPHPLDDHGRGIPLMYWAAEQIRYRHTRLGMEVIARWHV